jgi:hypothetical protein
MCSEMPPLAHFSYLGTNDKRCDFDLRKKSHVIREQQVSLALAKTIDLFIK